MNTIETALALVSTFNAVAPGIASLILLIRKKDGNVSVVALLDEADVQFQANMDAAKKWLEQNK